MACDRINGHGLHYREGLHAGITDGVKHVVTGLNNGTTKAQTLVEHGRVGQVVRRNGIGVLKAAGQVGSLGSHIPNVKQDFPWQAPLDGPKTSRCTQFPAFGRWL